jgi:tetratricopeptide (TPR) repeat protein
LPEAGDPTFARQAIEKSEKLASPDTYLGIKRSLKELGEARGKVGLNRELLTRGLLHESLFIVRFGDDANSAAHAAAIMKRLEERSFKAPGMALGRAADAARRKQWGEVPALIAQARAEAPSDPYVELVAGEAALATGKLPDAEKAFRKALQHGAGARAQWGLARTALRGTDVDAQVAAVNETLKLSPMHAEARIAEARILWQQGKEDRALHLLRVALGLEPTEEDQYLWTSKVAVAAGYGLLGYVHESRGRLHDARQAYEQALAADPYRVDALLGSGRVLLRERRFADAQARFEAALTAATKGGENPTMLSGRKADAEAQLGIGRALMGIDRANDAKVKLLELSKQKADDPEVVLALGEAEQALGNTDAAEGMFRKSIELAPKRFDGYLSLSQLFFKKGDAAKASEVLNDAATKVEETAEMRRMLGQSELARNRLESAVHEFKRALELDPHDTDAMFGMAIAQRKHGELDQAEKTLAEIEKRDPGFGGLAEQSGLLFEAKGDFKKAVEAYRSALEKDPGDNALLLRLGAAQVSSGDYDNAEQTLAKVVREMPNSAEAEYFIGRIAFARGRTPDALTHFDRAVGLEGTRGEFHLYVARASLEMGNLGRTLEEIQAAMNYDPNLGDAYWVRAVVRLRMGAVKDALNDLNKALKLNPGRTEAYAVRGDCYEQLRQLPEAIAAYRTALGRDPARGEWWYRLAMLGADSGNRGEADASVKRAIEIGDKTDPMPYWLPDAYRLAGENAEARSDRTGSIRLYKRYVEIAATAAIDRREIEKKLKGWGVELEQEE